MKTMRLLSILMLWVAVALEQPARAAATNKASELPRQNAFSNTNFNFLGQSNASGAAPLSVQMTPEAALGVLKRNAEWPGTSIATNGSAPSVTVTFGTNSWVLPWSGPLVSGFLHSNDWAAFNAKAGTNAPIFTGQVKILGNDLLLDGNLWLTNDIYSEGTIIAQGSLQASNYVRAGTGFQLGNVYLLHGNGTPEGSVSALPQSLYLQTNQTAGIGLWLKTNGTSNTGWWLLAPGSSGGGSSNMQAAAIGYLTMTNLVFNSVTNLGTNAVQVWDASTKRFARSGVYGNTTIVFTNMSTVTNLVGGQFAVDYSAEVFVQQNGQSVTLATLHPVTSESFTFTGGTTNYLTIRWNGTNWSARTSHSPTTGSGSFVLSNAPSIYAPTLLGQTALGTDGAIRFDEHSSAPSAPASGSVALYAKSDGLLYSKDSANTETLVSGTIANFSISNSLNYFSYLSELKPWAPSTTNVAWLTNTFVATPFTVTYPMTLRLLGLNAVNGVASTRCRIGIYASTSAADFYPSALVVDSGELDLSSSGDKTAAVDVAMTPGIYWAAVLVNGDTTVPHVRCLNTSFGQNNQLLGAANLGNAIRNVITVTNNYGALPSTFPSGAALGGSTVTTPAIGAKFQ